MKASGTYLPNAWKSVDFVAKGASITADGVEFDVPAGAFERVGRRGSKYRFRLRVHHGVDWTIEIDADEGERKLDAKHLDTTTMDPTDGLDIELEYAEQEGDFLVPVESNDHHERHWRFTAEDGAECACPAGADRCDDDSDSDSDSDSGSGSGSGKKKKRKN